MEATINKQDYFVADPSKQTLLTIAKDEDDQFELPLIDKIQMSPDTFKFVFGLPKPDEVLGLPVGGHVFFHFKDSDGEVVSRKYTPISTVNERGKVVFLIKLYLPSEEYPKGG
jgi:nitrate reductase (NAD(P)H)